MLPVGRIILDGRWLILPRLKLARAPSVTIGARREFRACAKRDDWRVAGVPGVRQAHPTPAPHPAAWSGARGPPGVPQAISQAFSRP